MHSPSKNTWWDRLKERFGEFLLGTALSWVMVPYTVRKGKEFEKLFALFTSVRLMGLPVLPHAYEMKLLPFLVPSLLNWRRLTSYSKALEGADLKHIGH